MIEISPSGSAVALALVGHRVYAAEVNVAASFGTFVAAIALTIRVDHARTVHRARPAVLRRSVQRVPGRADRVRRLHDVALLAAVHADRAGARAPHARAAAALPLDVPALQLHDAAGAPVQQPGHSLGRAGGGDAGDRAARVALPDAGEPRGGVEVFHPLRRRHRAGAVRHDPALLRRREAARRRRRRAAVDRARQRQGRPRADGALARVRVPARGLRHQGRAGAAAQLAAGRARRRADAGVRGALRSAAQRRAVRGRPLQGAGRRLVAHGDREGADDGLRPPFRRRRGVPAVATEGREAPLRVLVDRAHGDHHVRLRHGRRRSRTSPRCCT